MSGSLTVVAGVVGAFVLWETVLPWAFAALRKWLREQARAKEGEATNRTVAASATGVVTTDPMASATVPAAPSLRGVVTVDPLASASRGGRDPDWSEAEIAEGRTDLTAPRSEDAAGTVGDADADRLWEEARGMSHNFTPDWEKDREYLAKVYGAAKLGHLEAMVKLGDYAYRRGAAVEAFYWTFLAELKGAMGLDEALCEMRTQWLAEGCPAEFENAYAEFTEEQGDFARAVLCLQCEIDPQYARARLEELAERSCEEARLFLGKKD